MAYSKSDPMSTVFKVIKTALDSAERAHKWAQRKPSRNNNPKWAADKVQMELERIRRITERATKDKIP